MKHDLLLSLENQWIGRIAGRWQASPTPPTLVAPTRILTDFGSTVAGVMALDTKSDYAAAVIEKRLRGEGLLDGDARVLTHRIVAAGGGSRVFYTAVPVPAWQATFGWLGGEAALGLVYSVDAVMLAAACDHDIVVFAAGRHLRLLVSKPDALFYLGVSAFSDDIDDLHTIIINLATRLRQQWPALPQDCTLLWCDLLAREHAGPALPQALAAQLNARLTVAPVDSFLDEARPLRSAAAAVADRLPATVALNPWADRIAFLAEQSMKPVAAALAVAGVALLAYAAQLLVQSSQMQAQAAQIARSAAVLEQASTGLDGPVEQLLLKYKPTLDFVETLTAAVKSADAMAVLGDLRRAAEKRVRVMRVRQADSAGVFLVDGLPLAGAIDNGLSGFLGALRVAGYRVTAVDPGGQSQQPGFFSYSIRRANDGATP